MVQFYQEKLGISPKLAEEIKPELKEISIEAVDQYLQSVFGYRKYTPEKDPHEFSSAGLIERLSRVEALPYLAKQVVSSDIQRKAKDSLLMKIIGKYLASDQGSIFEINFPSQEIGHYFLQEEVTLENFRLLFLPDTFSEPKYMEKNFKTVLQSFLPENEKCAYYLFLLCNSSKSYHKNTSLANRITNTFLESDLSPEKRRKVAQGIIDGTLGSILTLFTRLPPLDGRGEKFKKEVEKLQNEAPFLVEISKTVKERSPLSVYPFNLDFVFRSALFWELSHLSSEEKKEFIQENFHGQCEEREIVRMKSFLAACEEFSSDLQPKFLRKVIEKGSESNRFEIRKEAYKVGYSLFGDEKYREGALEDKAKSVREWASKLGQT